MLEKEVSVLQIRVALKKAGREPGHGDMQSSSAQASWIQHCPPSHKVGLLHLTLSDRQQVKCVEYRECNIILKPTFATGKTLAFLEICTYNMKSLHFLRKYDACTTEWGTNLN